MPAVATRLTDAEIDAVSAYYAGLPQAAEQLAKPPPHREQAMNPRLTRLPGACLAAALALSMSTAALAAEPPQLHATVGRILARHRVRQDRAPG